MAILCLNGSIVGDIPKARGVELCLKVPNNTDSVSHSPLSEGRKALQRRLDAFSLDLILVSCCTTVTQHSPASLRIMRELLHQSPEDMPNSQLCPGRAGPPLTGTLKRVLPLFGTKMRVISEAVFLFPSSSSARTTGSRPTQRLLFFGMARMAISATPLEGRTNTLWAPGMYIEIGLP